MDQKIYLAYTRILESELVPALGCTEPIAIAYGAAKARQVLGQEPEHMEIRCSGNIIKNVKGVVVPNSGGMIGIEAAAALGALGGDADRELEVLESVRPEHIARAQAYIASGACRVRLVKDVENLYIVTHVEAGGHTAEVTIVNRHTLITRIVRDGETIYENEIHETLSDSTDDKALLNVRDILEYADTVDLDTVRPTLERQIELNTAISAEGLEHVYGAQVGRTLLQVYGDNVRTRARAKPAAGSDARMGGCALPVVINSGSGNQGLTVSLPVVEFARDLCVSHEKLLRALLVSNLVAVHLKKYIGSLSAFCGAVSAACGAGAAITYLYGGGYDDVGSTIVNTLATVGGIVCDGAKSSCASKIASAVDAAILAHYMGSYNRVFRAGEGLVKEDVEKTIRSMGYIGRVGMKETDEEILSVMIDEVEV